MKKRQQKHKSKLQDDYDDEDEPIQRKNRINKRRRNDAATRFIEVEAAESDDSETELLDKKEQFYDPKDL